VERSKFKIVDIPQNDRNSGQERCKVQERHWMSVRPRKMNPKIQKHTKELQATCIISGHAQTCIGEKAAFNLLLFFSLPSPRNNWKPGSTTEPSPWRLFGIVFITCILGVY
jgi:hypothetical protein